MKFLGLLLITFAIGFSTNSNAVITIGEKSCGEWVDDHANTNNSHLAMDDNFWLVGFLSGVAVESGNDFLRGSDDKSIILWMNNYCKSNPLRHATDGASALYKELKKLH